MRKLLTFLIALGAIVFAVVSPVSAQFVTLGAQGCGGGASCASGGGYTGPGDTVTGATAFWGVQCYTAAYTGNTVDVWDSATGSTTESQLGCNGSGGVVVKSGSALATTCASGCSVKGATDQTGNGNNLTQATNSHRPTYNQSAIGGKACMQFAGSQWLASSSGAPAIAAMPYTVTAFAEDTSAGGFVFTSNAELANLFFTTATAVQLKANGDVINSTISGTSFHTMQGIFGGTSANASTVVVDGAATAGTTSIATAIANVTAIGSNPAPDTPLTGFVCETGLWASAFNSTQYGAMNTNINSRY